MASMMYPQVDTEADEVHMLPRKRLNPEEEQTIQNVKYMMFAYNLVIFLLGGVVLGIGIWIAVDRSFMTYIIGNDLFITAIYMVLLGGGIVFFVALVGCCGAITENKCLLFTFGAVLAFIFFVLLLGGFIAVAFRVELGEAAKDTMEDTLINYYGVDLNEWTNWRVTQAWDKTQERLHCCGVSSDRGYLVYKQSVWYERYGAIDGMTQQKMGSEDQKPYVPQSCCVKDRFWRYVNLNVCQKWRLGPPGSPDDGAVNRALYYDGCYDAGLNYLWENADVLIGLGITVSFLLVIGILLAFYLWKKLP